MNILMHARDKKIFQPGVDIAESAPKTVKEVPSAMKLKTAVFWDCQGVMYVKYLEKAETVRAHMHCDGMA